MSPASLLLLSVCAIALTPPQRRPPKPPQKPPSTKQRRPNNQVPRAQKPKVTDGLAQLRSDAQAGRWREALATITVAEGAIESAWDSGATFFPLPVEAYNLAITACGNGRNHEEALGVLRRLTMGVSPEEGPGSAQAAKRPRPDAVTFNAAAAACAKAGDYRKAEQVLKQARRFNKLDAILCDLGVPSCGVTPSTRVHRTMTWVVSFSISRPFGPRRATAMLRAGCGAKTESRDHAQSHAREDGGHRKYPTAAGGSDETSR